MTFSLFSEKEQPEQAVTVEKHDDLPIMPGESSEDCLEPSEEVAVPSEIGQPIHEETTADADSESDVQEIMSELAAPPVEEKDNVVSCVPEETADEGSENQPKLNSCPETAEGGQAAGENDKSED